MSEYKITASNLYSVSQDIDDIEVKIEPHEFKIELSRVGAQGAANTVDTFVESASINSSRELILTTNFGQTVNAGVINQFSMGNYDISLDGGELAFTHSGTKIMTLDTNGNLKVAGDVDSNNTF